MTQPEPPPPLPSSQRHRIPLRRRIFIGVIAVIGVGLISLRPLGLIRPFSIPTGAMAPAISSGDHLMMEGFSYLVRKPRRGDVVVFRTTGIDGAPPNEIYIKRVAGEPGERVRI